MVDDYSTHELFLVNKSRQIDKIQPKPHKIIDVQYTGRTC